MKIVYFKEGGNGMTKKKKIVVLSVMCLLLVVTGYLNYSMANTNSSQKVASETIIEANFFDTYRQDRTDTRGKEIEYLDAIIASAESLNEHKQSATTQKIELVKKMETELALEGLIKAKGYDDVIVTIASDNYNVLVKSSQENLSSEEVAQILGIIVNQTKTDATNVKIIPIT